MLMACAALMALFVASANAQDGTTRAKDTVTRF
jgi:hypothetical protein